MEVRVRAHGCEHQGIECCSRGAQERGRTFLMMSTESDKFIISIQFHILMESKGMFLHMIDGCRSQNEKTQGSEGEMQKNKGKNASMGEVQNRILIQ